MDSDSLLRTPRDFRIVPVQPCTDEVIEGQRVEGRAGIESKFQPRSPHSQASVLLFFFFLILSNMSLVLSFLSDVILFLLDFLPILTGSLASSPLPPLPLLPLQGQASFFFPWPSLGGCALVHRTEREMTGYWWGLKCSYVLPEENLSTSLPKGAAWASRGPASKTAQIEDVLGEGWEEGREGELTVCLKLVHEILIPVGFLFV